MPTINVAFLGDIVGSPGRAVVQQQLPHLRETRSVDLVIANAENARAGSGLNPELYRKIRGYGVDAVTLGDHIYRDAKITSVLQDPAEPILRPANLSPKAIGQQWLRLPLPGRRDRSLFVVTVLGRIFFPLPADDPFAAVDRVLAELPEPNPLVIVEAHMEATSEKAALGHYLDGRVAAVIGSHTHIPTADARILPRGTAFITDVGMCGPYDSVIGRDTDAVLRYMTTAFPARFEVGSGGERMCGVLLGVDTDGARAVSIEPFQHPLDASQAAQA